MRKTPPIIPPREHRVNMIPYHSRRFSGVRMMQTTSMIAQTKIKQIPIIKLTIFILGFLS